MHVDDLMWLKKQLLKKFELETLLMGGDDDMVKEAVYLGRTMEWSEHGLGVRPDRRYVRSLLRELGMENCRSISLPRIGWIWEWRQLSSPKPWQFQEAVTTNVSNVLQDISIVILTTCNGHAVKHVDQIQVGLCSWGIISLPRGVMFNHALH